MKGRAWPLNNLWASMSKRERNLALITAGVVVALLGWFIVSRAIGAVTRLDAEIESLETDLVNLTSQAARLEPVDQVYSEVVEAHSSEWTQAEIYAMLRAEIVRLSLVEPPPEGALPETYRGAKLIDIPTFPQGVLDDPGGGYREYHMRVRTNPTDVKNVALFLQRLQESPQLLRVDRVEITRPNPAMRVVQADLTITRALVAEVEAGDAAPGARLGDNLIGNPDFDDWGQDGTQLEAWTTEALAIETLVGADIPGGGRALSGTAVDGPARLYQTLELPGGATYDLRISAAAEADARLGVQYEESGAWFGPDEAPVSILNDGQWHRYHLAFTTPGDPSDRVVVRAPCIEVSGEGDVRVDDGELVRRTE